MSDDDGSALVDALLDNAHDAVWVVSRELTVTRFNAAFARLCAKAFHRTLVRAGVNLGEILDDGMRELCVDLFRRAMSGRAATADARFTIEGMSRSYILSGAPVIGGHSVAGAAFNAHDVTELTRRAREDIFELSLTRLFLAGEKPLSATIASALSYVCQSDEWDGGVIWLVDATGSALEVASIHGENIRDDLAGVRL